MISLKIQGPIDVLDESVIGLSPPVVRVDYRKNNAINKIFLYVSLIEL